MFAKYTFSQGRAFVVNSNLRHQLPKFIKLAEKRTVLEIGSYEGSSACFFSDTILNHPESTLHCVDPYMRFEANDQVNIVHDTETEQRCRANIARSKNASKITLHTLTSDAYFEQQQHMYDLIYIDGCHIPEFIQRDMENSWACLRKGGIMWMDDYRGGPRGDTSIKRTMDAWLAKHAGEYKLLWKQYQLGVRKL